MRHGHGIVVVLAWAWVLALMGSRHALAQDLEEEISVRPRDWEPVVARFVVEPARGGEPDSRSVQPPREGDPQGPAWTRVGSLPSVVAAWEALKHSIPRPAPPDSSAAPAYVFSGWELVREVDAGISDSEAIVARYHRAHQGKQPVQLLAIEPAKVLLDFDVIASRSEDEDTELMLRLFRLAYIVECVHISDDPAKFMDPVPRDAEVVAIGGEGRFELFERFPEQSGIAWPDRARGLVRGGLAFEYSPRAVGVREFRFRCMVAGRFELLDEVQIKTFEGAIRVGFVDGQTFRVERLSFEQNRAEAQAPRSNR